MKIITQQDFSRALSLAPVDVRELMGSEKLYDEAKRYLEKTNSPVNPETVILPIGYYLLKLSSFEETLSELATLGVTDVYNFLKIFELLTKVESPKSTMSPEKIDPKNLAAEISATEHDLEALHAVRTMAHDMEEVKTHPAAIAPTPEPVHQSSQADLLRQIETMASPNNTPRWDTEK